jgi:hypothetical protein
LSPDLQDSSIGKHRVVSQQHPEPQSLLVFKPHGGGNSAPYPLEVSLLLRLQLELKPLEFVETSIIEG